MLNIRYLRRIFALSVSFAMLCSAASFATGLIRDSLPLKAPSALEQSLSMFWVALAPCFVFFYSSMTNLFLLSSIITAILINGTILTIGWVCIVKWLSPYLISILRFHIQALAVSVAYYLALALILIWYMTELSISDTSQFPYPLRGLLYYEAKYSGLGEVYALLHALAWGYGTVFCVRWLKRRRTRTAG